MVGTKECTPKKITVTGPASIVDQISTAVASVDVEGLSSETVARTRPVLYDSEGNEISTDRLELSKSKVSVDITFYEKKEVSLTALYSGTPAEGYEVSDVAVDPETITIAGSADALSAVNGIEIPESEVSVEGLSKETTVEVDFEQYLPEGIILVGVDNIVEVTVTIIPYEEVSVSYPVESINIKNLSKGYDVLYYADYVDITLECPAESAGLISAEDLTVSADMSNAVVGANTITLDVSLPNNVKLEEEPVTVIIVGESAE